MSPDRASKWESLSCINPPWQSLQLEDLYTLCSETLFQAEIYAFYQHICRYYTSPSNILYQILLSFE